MTPGQRIRVKQDNGRDGLVGFEGTVYHTTQTGVLVEIDNEPAHGRNMYTVGGFARTPKDQQVLRFFHFYEVEAI